MEIPKENDIRMNKLVASIVVLGLMLGALPGQVRQAGALFGGWETNN